MAWSSSQPQVRGSSRKSRGPHKSSKSPLKESAFLATSTRPSTTVQACPNPCLKLAKIRDRLPCSFPASRSRKGSLEEVQGRGAIEVGIDKEEEVEEARKNPGNTCTGRSCGLACEIKAEPVQGPSAEGTPSPSLKSPKSSSRLSSITLELEFSKQRTFHARGRGRETPVFSRRLRCRQCRHVSVKEGRRSPRRRSMRKTRCRMQTSGKHILLPPHRRRR